MSFAAIEGSNYSGRPIFLYAFTLGSATWRYTSSDEDVSVDGYTWKATAIVDDGVKLTGDATTDALTITAPNTIAPVQMFFGTPPSQSIMVKIYHYHEDDTQAVLAYAGELLQVNQPQPGTATITCDAISASLQRDGLRLAWQRTCPHALYDPISCGVDKTKHARKVKVSDTSGATVLFSGMAGVPDGTFNGGFIEWDHPSRGKEFLAIETQVGNVCEMFGMTDGLYFGLEVTAYPGCDRTTTACVKFNNLDNYGGVPDMPGKSPFDGNPVF